MMSHTTKQVTWLQAYPGSRVHAGLQGLRRLRILPLHSRCLCTTTADGRGGGGDKPKPKTRRRRGGKAGAGVRSKALSSGEEAPAQKIAANLIDSELHVEANKSYLAYALSVIVGRALPDARDGLKPVQIVCGVPSHEACLQWFYFLGKFFSWRLSNLGLSV